MSRQHWFIVPPLDGPPSGGTRYNRELLAALGALGFPAGTLDPPSAMAALARADPGVYWVDTLFLDLFAAFVRENHARRPLGLLAHYLPSLVEHGDAVDADELTPAERFALAHADLVLAPSDYLRRTLLRLGLAPSTPCVVVEPGYATPAHAVAPPPLAGVKALLIANLTPGKGVEPFLRALGGELRAEDRLQLELVGRIDSDAGYAEACFAAVERAPALRGRVEFRGALAPAEVAARLGASNLLVSASRMETFGMAVAEARSAGVPVVALARGNVPALVTPAAGGRLAESDAELALACGELSRRPEAHARALELARRNALPPRSFADAAREFVAQLSSIGFTERA